MFIVHRGIRAWAVRVLAGTLLSTLVLPGTGSAETGEAPALAPEQRLDAVEQRLAFVDRKLELLAAKSELELVESVSAELLSKPALLLELGRASFKREDYALAYRYLALLEALHPESPETQEAFPLAAAAFHREYMGNRYRGNTPLWHTAETAFMFQWLTRYIGEDFPKEQADRLLVGLPLSASQKFIAYVQSRPDLSMWVVTATEDDGIVNSVEGRRKPPGVKAKGKPKAK